MIPANILGTGSYLPGRAVPTREVALATLPGKDPDAIAAKIGISTRHWAEPGTTAADAGAEALRRALADARMDAKDIRRLVFVNSVGGDSLIPATAHHVCGRMGLDDSCDAFDLNNSCTGFLTSLDLAARSVATGSGPVAIVVAEILSRYLPVDKPRPYLVLGDAAAAVIVGKASGASGIVASYLRSTADLRREVNMAHPGLIEGGKTFLQFDATYDVLIESAVRAVETSSRRVLDDAGIGMADVTWFLPHQPNGKMFEKILSIMNVSADRTVNVVNDIGSVGAASVPVSLDRLRKSGRVREGDRLLMSAVGAGTGYGAVLFQMGAS